MPKASYKRVNNNNNNNNLPEIFVKCWERSSTRLSKLGINPNSPDDFPWPSQSMPWTSYPFLTNRAAQSDQQIKSRMNIYIFVLHLMFCYFIYI